VTAPARAGTGGRFVEEHFMAADQNGTAAQGSLLRLTTKLRLQVKELVEASAALNKRSGKWKPEARGELGRVLGAGEKMLALLGPPAACPQCQQPLAYLPEHKGRNVRCVPCGHRFRLEFEPPAPAAAAAPATPKKRKRGNGLLVGAMAGVVALALASVGAAWLASTGRADKFVGKGYSYDYLVPLKDDVEANRTVTDDLLDLSFLNAQGQPVKLAEYRGKKNLVLVVMRGFTGQVCLGCLAQTSRLIKNYAEFTKRDAEVVVAYPGQRDHLQQYLERSLKEGEAASCPFPVLLDEDAKMVDRLGIRANLASPSTYILDQEGKVRFAYVGSTITDRPSVKAMLTQLDRLAASK
jgi:peroxiredoxin